VVTAETGTCAPVEAFVATTNRSELLRLWLIEKLVAEPLPTRVMWLAPAPDTPIGP
jgi:hypothetical protein